MRMGARAIVVHPPFSLHRQFIDYPYFSDLGAVQLAAVLRTAGHATGLVDAFALPSAGVVWRKDGRVGLGAPVEEVLQAIASADGDLGGVDAIAVALTPFHRPPGRCDLLGDLLAGLRARYPETPIWLADCYQSGQHYVEANVEAVLAAYSEADAWVKYEAEVTVPGLLADLAEGGQPPRGGYAGTVPASLDALPFPAWDLVDLDAYFAFHARVVAEIGRGQWAFPIDGRTLPMVTSRGCPFACVHCSSNPGRAADQAKTQRRYSRPRLREYLQTLARDCRPTRLAVLDELANVDEAHFDALLEEIDSVDLPFEIPNGLRADYLEPRHLDKMRGRLTTLSVSAESGVQRVVDDVIGKRLDLRCVEQVAADASAAEIPLLVHFLIGLPGESALEINQTLAFAMRLHELHGARPSVQFATPLPGTALASDLVLPTAEDWGARLQTRPSTEMSDRAVPAEVLSKFKWTFDKRLQASAAPAKLIVNLTYQCNNHCRFCAVGNRAKVHGDPAKQLAQLERYRASGVAMVDFDGGEPTLAPALVPLIHYARDIGYERIAVTTNGRLCAYPDVARELVGSGVTTLLFSLHGPDAETHAREVGVAEAFEQTTAGIRNCVELAPDDVELGMNFTVTSGNWDQLNRMASLCWELGLRWLNIQFLTPFGRATRQVAPDVDAAAGLTMRVIDAWRNRLRIEVINLPFCYLPGYERFATGDLLKAERHMLFVNDESVNLAAYLAERRVRAPQCADCPHAIFCAGFYELDDVPEPPWTSSGETGDSSSEP